MFLSSPQIVLRHCIPHLFLKWTHSAREADHFLLDIFFLLFRLIDHIFVYLWHPIMCITRFISILMHGQLEISLFCFIWYNSEYKIESRLILQTVLLFFLCDRIAKQNYSGKKRMTCKLYPYSNGPMISTESDHSNNQDNRDEIPYVIQCCYFSNQFYVSLIWNKKWKKFYLPIIIIVYISQTVKLHFIFK
jgi:hypothetical protein